MSNKVKKKTIQQQKQTNNIKPFPLSRDTLIALAGLKDGTLAHVLNVYYKS